METLPLSELTNLETSHEKLSTKKESLSKDSSFLKDSMTKSAKKSLSKSERKAEEKAQLLEVELEKTTPLKAENTTAEFTNLSTSEETRQSEEPKVESTEKPSESLTETREEQTADDTRVEPLVLETRSTETLAPESSTAVPERTTEETLTNDVETSIETKVETVTTSTTTALETQELETSENKRRADGLVRSEEDRDADFSHDVSKKVKSEENESLIEN